MTTGVTNSTHRQVKPYQSTVKQSPGLKLIAPSNSLNITKSLYIVYGMGND